MATQPKASLTPEEFLEQIIPETRREAVEQLRQTIIENLPLGFEEGVVVAKNGSSFLSYHVPKSRYPPGYHCDPASPLPFISVTVKQNHVALHHIGLYADPALSEWFVTEHSSRHHGTKLDMGKGCIRFKHVHGSKSIPYGLIGEVVRKVSVADWIARYEATMQTSKTPAKAASTKKASTKQASKKQASKKMK
jgi:hypothetical protein